MDDTTWQICQSAVKQLYINGLLNMTIMVNIMSSSVKYVLSYSTSQELLPNVD